MIEPWEHRSQTQPYRLGLYLHHAKHEGLTGSALGWAVLAMQPKGHVGRGGTVACADDHIAQIVGLYEREASRHEMTGEVQLYGYLTERSFADSRAAAEGMTRHDHRALIFKTLAALKTAGIPATIEWIS